MHKFRTDDIFLVESGLDELCGTDAKKAPSVSDGAFDVALAYDDAQPAVPFGVRKLLDIEEPAMRMASRKSARPHISTDHDMKVEI